MSRFKIAAIQMGTKADKMENISVVEGYLKKLSDEKVDIIVLPEMFCCPYITKNFPIYADEEGGQAWEALSKLASKYHVYLVAGSMPEKNKEGNVFNTSYVFDREGKQIGKHRKAHLFDIDIKGGQYFKESDTLTAGDKHTTFETEFGTMGLCICYDLRFPELSRLMIEDGAKMIFVPGAFNMTTGPAHWEILFRTRALDNQVYTLGVAPARESSTGYISWGHSILVDPWGKVVNCLEEKEEYFVEEVDLDYVSRVREELPMLVQRRKDIYTLNKSK